MRERERGGGEQEEVWKRSRYSRSLKRMIWAVNISINYFVTTFKIYIH